MKDSSEEFNYRGNITQCIKKEGGNPKLPSLGSRVPSDRSA